MTYASAGGRKRAKDTVGHWALAGALAVELVWAAISLGSHIQGYASIDLASALGQIAGHTVYIAAIVWAVAYFGFVRRAAPERGLPYALILLFVPIVLQAGVVLWAQHVQEQKAQVRTVAQEMESSLSTLAHPVSGAAPMDTRPKASGEAGEFERLMKSYMADLQSDHAAYMAELRGAGVLDALKPEHIAKDRSLRAARASLATGKAIAKKYRERYHARKLEFRQAVAHSALTPADQGVMLASFDRAQAHGDQGDEIWDVEDAFLSEMDATAADLQHAHGRWAARGHVVMFSDPADLQAYNQHMAKLQALTARENALRDAGLQQAMHGVEEMRRAAE